MLQLFLPRRVLIIRNEMLRDELLVILPSCDHKLISKWSIFSQFWACFCTIQSAQYPLSLSGPDICGHLLLHWFWTMFLKCSTQDCFGSREGSCVSLGFWGETCIILPKAQNVCMNLIFQFHIFTYDLHSYHSPTRFHIKMSISPKHSTLKLWDDVLSTCALQLRVLGPDKPRGSRPEPNLLLWPQQPGAPAVDAVLAPPLPTWLLTCVSQQKTEKAVSPSPCPARTPCLDLHICFLIQGTQWSLSNFLPHLQCLLLPEVSFITPTIDPPSFKPTQSMQNRTKEEPVWDGKRWSYKTIILQLSLWPRPVWAWGGKLLGSRVVTGPQSSPPPVIINYKGNFHPSPSESRERLTSWAPALTQGKSIKYLAFGPRAQGLTWI